MAALTSTLLQDSVAMVRDLFRDQQSTEFIIATIPTVLGVKESARLAAALEKERIVCKRIIVNQVLMPQRNLLDALIWQLLFVKQLHERGVVK